MVTFALLLLVNVSGLVAVAPTLMLPNANAAGAGVMVGRTPVPLAAGVKGESAPSFVILNPPETLPAAVGVKRTVAVTLAPLATVVGSARPVIVSDGLVPDIAETTTGFPPVFVRV